MVTIVAFTINHGFVDLAHGNKVVGPKIFVEETFVVAEIHIGLGSVFAEEGVTMLDGVNQARIDIEIVFAFDHGHRIAAGLQKQSEWASGDTFA